MRPYNFAAGPAALPLPVLERAQSELIEHGSDGMSVMEMSHRSPMYQRIIDRAEATLRELMEIPDDYAVLFMQGGATLQFSGVPLNLMHGGKANYVVSGNFAKKAAQEAARYGTVLVVGDSSDRNYTYIPRPKREEFDPSADYVHITANNTIYGTSWRTNLPDVGELPLVADMTSCILSEVYDIRKFGLVYAGAQKNAGIAGMTIVVGRRDLMEQGLITKAAPSVLEYKNQIKNGSMMNTPPTYAIYIAGLVFDWVKEQGSVAALQKVNEQKAALLYDVLDHSSFYKAVADKADRSIMNVTFVTPSEDLNAAFVAGAKEAGLVNLKGHRATGGIRASIYNAMPLSGVEALAQFMKEFERKNG